MGDLKWVTLGFVENFIDAITRDQLLTPKEKKYFSDSAKRIKRAVERATTIEDQEDHHHAFHNLRGLVLVVKLTRQTLNRNNK